MCCLCDLHTSHKYPWKKNIKITIGTLSEWKSQVLMNPALLTPRACKDSPWRVLSDQSILRISYLRLKWGHPESENWDLFAKNSFHIMNNNKSYTAWYSAAKEISVQSNGGSKTCGTIWQGTPEWTGWRFRHHRGIWGGREGSRYTVFQGTRLQVCWDRGRAWRLTIYCPPRH